MTVPKLSIRHVSKEFATGRDSVLALDDVSLDLEENAFTTLVGTSGCGKTTLLSIVAGLEEQTSGEVLLDGEAVVGPGRDRGVVFQSYTLFPWLTARKNVEFALRAESMSAKQRTTVANEHLASVGLADFGDRYPAELSGGMRQRVAIARALSYQPEVLLMDEPFGALDAQTRQVMQELLTNVWERHRLTVLFVTHDIDEAVFLSDRVIVLSSRPGRIKEDVEVDLPRPRRFELLSSPELGAYKGRLLEAVRAEALKDGRLAVDSESLLGAGSTTEQTSNSS